MTDRDPFDCDSIQNSGPVCFTKLGETVDSSWQHLCDEVRGHIAHWHCCSTKWYWGARIAGKFDITLAEFYADSFVRLADVLGEREVGQKLLRCRTAAELEEHCRRCILKSLERVRDQYRRDRKRATRDSVLTDDEPAPPDTWYLRHELLECLKRFDDEGRDLLYEVWELKRSQKEVAAERGKHPATIGRQLEKMEDMLRQCLLEKGFEL